MIRAAKLSLILSKNLANQKSGRSARCELLEFCTKRVSSLIRSCHLVLNVYEQDKDAQWTLYGLSLVCLWT